MSAETMLPDFQFLTDKGTPRHLAEFTRQPLVLIFIRHLA